MAEAVGGGDSGRRAGAATPRGESLAFAAALVALTALALVPLWASGFPALQDYPYHLAQIEVLRSIDAPASPYREHFTADPTLRPYAAFYAIATLLARVVAVETAGRITLSLYFVLWALLIARCPRSAAGAPWGSLLLLPLAITPPYYLGFVNYLLSLPLLGLALVDHERFLRGGGVAPALALGLWVGGLFFTHPFTFLVFLAFGGLRSLESGGAGRHWRRALAPLAIAALAFGAWFWWEDAARGATGPEGVHWIPLRDGLALLSFPFTGMKGLRDAAWAPLLVWTALAVLFAGALRAGGLPAGSRFWAIALALTALAVFALPFRMGHYSYISWRIVGVSSLCLGMLAAGLRLRGPARAAWVALVAVALGLSVQQQLRISRELEEVAPLLERIPADAALLPLVFDDDSPELDPAAFDVHLHVHHYHHVRRRGGVTPYFFPHPLVPVRYRGGSPPPAPPQYRPDRFRWQRHGAWQYLLVRAAPEPFLAYLLSQAEEVASSGRWRLLHRVSPAAAAPPPGPS